MATIRTLRPACSGIKSHCQILRIVKQAPALFNQQNMGYPTDKHYDPRFKKQRTKKIIKPELPDFEYHLRMQQGNSMTPDEIRMQYKKYGTKPFRKDQDKPLDISSSGEVWDEFVPPEGDGKSSFLSGSYYSSIKDKLKMKGKSLNHVRSLKKYEDQFKADEFAEKALEIFIEAQSLLQDIKKNEDKLHSVVTESAYAKMTFGLEHKTFRWQYMESIEPPTVVHVRVGQLLSKENLCAQITVRFHSKQILAIYDRFGRLMFGNENIAKDVLEYVVFEKHIVDYYGKWKVHAKIIPSWLPPPEPLVKTYRKPDLPDIPEDKGVSNQKIPYKEHVEGEEHPHEEKIKENMRS